MFPFKTKMASFSFSKAVQYIMAELIVNHNGSSLTKEKGLFFIFVCSTIL